MTTTIRTRPAGLIDSLLDAYVRLDQQLANINAHAPLASAEQARRLDRRRTFVADQLAELSTAVYDVLTAHHVTNALAATDALIAAHRVSEDLQ